ncbi:MAG: sensor histidine kinase [Burkholderiaceae bacterium]
MNTRLSVIVGHLRRRWFVTLAGCAVLLAACAGVAAWHYQALRTQFNEESRTLHSLLSQRVDQHDAHLTALSAIAQAPLDPDHSLFLNVADTITRFYPRIDNVLLVPLVNSAPAVGTQPVDPALAGTVRSAANAARTTVAIQKHPLTPAHYILVKRSPNTDTALYGLMLGIDAYKLIHDIGSFWRNADTTLQLSLPDGQTLVPGAPGHPLALHFSQPLASSSQPLLLQTRQRLGFADLFPVLPMIILLSASALMALALLLLLRQRAKMRAAVEGARLSSLESRLAHASRVNTLGEMAGGIAHELTQPLTAILAQAQAGKRLLERGDTGMVRQVLGETVTQAQRAAALLERLRNWSRPQGPRPGVMDLRVALANVNVLLSREAAAGNVRVEFRLPGAPVLIRADPVEMEQVAFNLVRNAIEATTGAATDPRVIVKLHREGNLALLDIMDNGPGVPDTVRARLFAPFTTTRPHGTGLGLTLSQRLVERAGGDLSLVDTATGATFRVCLPSAEPDEAAL